MSIEPLLEMIMVLEKKFRNAVDDYKKGSEKSVKTRLVIILSILISLFLLFFLI